MARLTRIDRHFRRFVRAGDARALGKVFDASAPELLKIAAYLSGDRQQAEDLVQSAFLVAIERRQEFDTTRPVMPWLCGIVANLARNERRRAPGPQAVASGMAPEDPVAAAEMAEFRSAFADARDGLPAPYRPVLELYLEHGLRAGEIARVLDRPSGTVRAQITRGLEALRKRLPRGFVAGAVVAAVSPAALQAMRTVVVSEARIATSTPILVSAATAPWAAAVIGGGTLNKKLIAAGLVGASLLALGVWFANGAATGPEVDPTNVPPNAMLAVGGAEEDAEGVRAATPDRLAVAVAETEAPSTLEGSVEVAVVWKDTGAPAVKQAVEVVLDGGRMAEARPRRELTNDEGHCTITGVPAGEVTVFTSTGERQRVEVGAGETAAVKFELKCWGTVNGVVVDADGRRVADADVFVSSEVRYHQRRRGYGPGHGQYGSFTLRSDAHGEFQTRLGMMQCLSASKAGYGPSKTIYPSSGKAPPEGVDVVLRLAAEGSALAVEVRDTAGKPVADAHVMVGFEVPHYTVDAEAGTTVVEDMHATTPALRANTDANGIADLSPLPVGSLPVQVRAAGYAPWKGKHELPPSAQSSLIVHLEPAAVVFGAVTDPEGEPVAGAIISYGPPAKLNSSQCASDAEGRFELSGLPAGKVEVTAWKKDIGSCQTELIAEPGGRHEWAAQLSMRPAITGVVLDLAGRPAAGAGVFCHSDKLGTLGGSSKTGPDGRFFLGPLDPGATYSIVAEVVGENGASRVRKTGIAPETDLVLQVVAGAERNAHLRGRLLEPDGKPATQVHMVVHPVKGTMGYAMSIEETGEFKAGPTVPGRIRLTVMRRMKTIADLGEHELVAHQTTDLGDVYLPSPGGVALRIRGGDVKKGVANLYRGGHLMDSQRLNGQEIEWTALQPGDYKVCVRRGGDTPQAGVGSFTVASGSTVRAEMDVFPAHRCELRLVGDGEYRRYGTLTAEMDGREVLRDSVMIPKDETERVLLPAGELVVKFRTADGWSSEQRVTVPAKGVIELQPRR